MTGGLCGLRARLLRKAFVFFPVAGGLLCCAAAYLRNVTLCPLLLVLSLAPLQIVSNTPVHDLVADLEVVLVRVTLFAQGFSSPFHGKIQKSCRREGIMANIGIFFLTLYAL
jgi:hypothetical protein